MAWLTQVRKKTVTSFKVCWRETGSRTERSKSFRTEADAVTFQREMTELWPDRSPRESVTPQTKKNRIQRAVKIDENGCWRWQLKIAKTGYGVAAGPRRAGQPKTVLAHRLSYETFVGNIPDGLQIDHLCRVRDCVNPLHLEPVTGDENLRRARLAKVNSGQRISILAPAGGVA